MPKVKFYLDTKSDKHHNYPIHLRIRQRSIQIKVATSEKLKKKDWDPSQQRVKNSNLNHKYLNQYLQFLKAETEKYLDESYASNLTDRAVREKITALVNLHKTCTEKTILKENEEYYGKERFTFID